MNKRCFPRRIIYSVCVRVQFWNLRDTQFPFSELVDIVSMLPLQWNLIFFMHFTPISFPPWTNAFWSESIIKWDKKVANVPSYIHKACPATTTVTANGRVISNKNVNYSYTFRSSCLVPAFIFVSFCLLMFFSRRIVARVRRIVWCCIFVSRVCSLS